LSEVFDGRRGLGASVVVPRLVHSYHARQIQNKRREAFNGCLCEKPTGSFRAARSGQRMSVQGRPLPAVDVSYPVAQVEGQLSGGEFARPTDAGRPIGVGHRFLSE
jgi:hypothetical protein